MKKILFLIIMFVSLSSNAEAIIKYDTTKDDVVKVLADNSDVAVVDLKTAEVTQINKNFKTSTTLIFYGEKNYSVAILTKTDTKDYLYITNKRVFGANNIPIFKERIRQQKNNKYKHNINRSSGGLSSFSS